jgi:hypothetical protein
MENRRWTPDPTRTQKQEESVAEFHSHGVSLTCRRYLWRQNRTDWIIDCETTSRLQTHNLRAEYFGAADGIPDFYQVIQNVRPAD